MARPVRVVAVVGQRRRRNHRRVAQSVQEQVDAVVGLAADGTVHLWDVSAFDDAPSTAARDARAEVVQTLNIEHCEVLCIVPSADGTALFCGLDDGRVALLSDVDGPAEEY